MRLRGPLIGLSAFVLASPIIHFAHANSDAGFLSLGIRAGSATLLLVGTALLVRESFSGPLFGNSRHDSSSPLPLMLVIVGFSGMLTAILTDAIALAFERRLAPAPDARAALLPFVDPRSGTAGLELVGAL